MSGAQSDVVKGPAVAMPVIPDEAIVSICEAYGNDRHRMLDILRDVQDRFHWISPKVMEDIALQTGLSRIEVVTGFIARAVEAETALFG